MRVIYIAAPFRASNAWEIEQNIRRAECAALEVWRMGAAALCPHTNTRFYQGALPDEVWLLGDLELLKRCDAVCFLPGWGSSAGCKAEMVFAIENEIPALQGVRAVQLWLEARSAE